VFSTYLLTTSHYVNSPRPFLSPVFYLFQFFYHFEVFRKATESLKLYNLDEMTPIRKLFGLPPPTQPPPAPTHTGRVGNKKNHPKKPTQKTH
jgi:hypothetical protein